MMDLDHAHGLRAALVAAVDLAVDDFMDGVTRTGIEIVSALDMQARGGHVRAVKAAYTASMFNMKRAHAAPAAQ